MDSGNTLCGTPTKRRRSGGVVSAPTTVDDLKLLHQMATRQEVTVEGFNLAMDEKLHRGNTTGKEKKGRDVAGLMLADTGALMQLTLWGDVASKNFPHLTDLLAATDDGAFPKVRVAGAQIIGFKGPTAPSLRRLQSTPRTSITHLDTQKVTVSPALQLLTESATVLMAVPLVSCFKGVVTRLSNVIHTRDDVAMKEIGVTMVNGFEVPVMLYGAQAEEDVEHLDMVSIWFGESRRALPDHEESKGMIWLFESGYLLKLGRAGPIAAGRPMVIGGDLCHDTQHEEEDE